MIRGIWHSKVVSRCVSLLGIASSDQTLSMLLIELIVILNRSKIVYYPIKLLVSAMSAGILIKSPIINFKMVSLFTFTLANTFKVAHFTEIPF
jgi:hypothetical protein